MPRRHLWMVDMADGSYAVSCTGCMRGLFRGRKREAVRVFSGHRCEPTVPLRRGRGRR